MCSNDSLIGQPLLAPVLLPSIPLNCNIHAALMSSRLRLAALVLDAYALSTPFDRRLLRVFTTVHSRHCTTLSAARTAGLAYHRSDQQMSEKWH